MASEHEIEILSTNEVSFASRSRASHVTLSTIFAFSTTGRLRPHAKALLVLNSSSTSAGAVRRSTSPLRYVEKMVTQKALS